MPRNRVSQSCKGFMQEEDIIDPSSPYASIDKASRRAKRSSHSKARAAADTQARVEYNEYLASIKVVNPDKPVSRKNKRSLQSSDEEIPEPKKNNRNTSKVPYAVDSNIRSGDDAAD